jgi:hypothetical protein
VSAASASAEGPRASAAKTSDEQTTIAIASQARLVMTAPRSTDFDSLATLGASGLAAPNARTVKPPKLGVNGSIYRARGIQAIVRNCARRASLWRRRSYLSAFLRRPADA